MPDSDKGQDLMPSNTAVWLPKKRGKLEIGPAPYPHPRENEIVVQNRAVAINPIDWLIQAAGNVIFTWLRYPFVLGCDLAGDVVEVGSAVTRFRVDDRVLGHAVGTDKKRNNPAEGAFQNYTVVLAHMAAPLPDSLAYENAAVLPLALSTAACGLFQTDHLALEHPCSAPVPTGTTLLVWGGSTSVGSNAIQLAVAAGYDVVTTCSPRNFGYVRKLGASRAFDYHSSTVVEDIVDALEGKTIAGALAIGGGSGAPCVDIVRACQGRKFVSMASAPVSFEELAQHPGTRLALPRLLLRLVAGNVALQVKSRSGKVGTKVIFGSTLMDNEVRRVIYQDFLPTALSDGSYVAAPEPRVIGTGLHYVQTGFDAQSRGVSATKVVVSL